MVNMNSSVYPIKKLIGLENIFITEYKEKNDFLNFFIDKGMNIPGIINREDIANAMFKREELMSTGIGLSIAVPHVRIGTVKDLNVFIAINTFDIMDYKSLDDQPVRIGVFIVVGKDQHSEYVKALSVIVERLKNSSIRERLLKAESKNDIYNCLMQEVG